MKKLTIISVYLTFGIALMRVAGVPAPLVRESFQAPVAFKRHVANGMISLETSDPSNVTSLFHNWRTIVSREFSMKVAFTDFESLQLGRPTQTSVPASIHTASTGSTIPASAGKETLVAARNPTSIATTTTWATWTATVTGVATSVATYTSYPLLDRLIKNRPLIWGNKGFYVLLGVLYLTLLGLFLKQMLETLKRQS